MTIDWINFAPWSGRAGGVLIGLAAAAFILLNGRIAGISGIVGGLLREITGARAVVPSGCGIAQKRHNSRFANRSRGAFIKLMGELNLPNPRLIDVAVPANQNLGLPHGA